QDVVVPVDEYAFPPEPPRLARDGGQLHSTMEILSCGSFLALHVILPSNIRWENVNAVTFQATVQCNNRELAWYVPYAQQCRGSVHKWLAFISDSEDVVNFIEWSLQVTVGHRRYTKTHTEN
ncbi:MAG: hypothetical protein QF704_16370, partial [Anaerolineales bacterium]|nr:hypothetical protein [Anaerolineales bacterium]